MTGTGHRLTGIGAAFLAAALARLTDMPEFVAAVVALASTTMPDWIELPFYRNGVRTGSLIPHRTITHWPVLWCIVGYWGAHEGGVGGAMLLGAAVGSMVHILGDAPNPMGIPWIVPFRRLRFGQKGWWKSGQREPLIVLAFAACGYAFWSAAGGRFG